MMRLLVGRSTHPSPFRRAVPLAELERVFTVLHGSIIQALADEKLGIANLEGSLHLITSLYFMFCQEMLTTA